jgi:alpha-glucosidase
MSSPGEHIQATLSLVPGSSLVYRVLYNDELIIEESPLGFVIDGKDFGSGIEQLKLVESGEVNKKVPGILMGKNYINHYRYYHYQVIHPKGDFQVQLRLFRDGFAFRYRFTGQGGKLTRENTAWKIPFNGRVWFFERSNHWKLKSYAGLWQSTLLDSLPVTSHTGPVQGKPLLIELPDKGYMMLTEAALYNYSGMRLEAAGDLLIRANFTEGEEGFQIEKDQVSPWRVILVANDLNELVNNNTIANLNPPPQSHLFSDTDWIKPGRSVWSWWSRDENYMTLKNERDYVNYAARLNFKYALLDEGWERWNDKWNQLKALQRYAAGNNVGLWVWKHSKELTHSSYMNAFLDSVKAAGVVGIKVDFMNSEAKEWIDFDRRLLEACAHRQLMVNFHGCQASSGEYITWPNELTREGVRGLELNSMGRPIPAWHNAALPFTRLITGPADYTPLSFSNPGNTTWPHQLATAVIFDSPFQCMAEDPRLILETESLSSVVPFLNDLPVVWDQTMVLPISETGKLAAFARRKGNEWYIAVINGEPKLKELTLEVSFGEYEGSKARFWMDEGTGKIEYEEKQLSRDNTIPLSLDPNGGVVVKIEKAFKQLNLK